MPNSYFPCQVNISLLTFQCFTHICKVVWEISWTNCLIIQNLLLKENHRPFLQYLFHSKKTNNNKKNTFACAVPTTLTTWNLTANKMLYLLWPRSRGQVSWSVLKVRIHNSNGQKKLTAKNVWSRSCVISSSYASYDCHNSRLDQRCHLGTESLELPYYS